MMKVNKFVNKISTTNIIGVAAKYYVIQTHSDIRNVKITAKKIQNVNETYVHGGTGWCCKNTTRDLRPRWAVIICSLLFEP